MDNYLPYLENSIIVLIKIYEYLIRRRQIHVIEGAVSITNVMALLAVPFKPSYIALKNLR